MNAGVKRLLFGALSRLVDSGAGQGEPTTETLAQMQLELDHLRKHFALLAAERDVLSVERGELLVKLQSATRFGGIAEHGRARDVIAPFPAAILPAGRYPRLTIVDVGAQQLSFEAHAYQALVDLGIADVVGFEPIEEHAEKRAKTESGVTMLNYFVGNGAKGVFRQNRFDPTSSLFPTNFALLDRFQSLSDMCTPVSEHEVETTRLDDIEAVRDCDFLKIDVQGGELDVLAGAPAVLERTVAVHCEVEFAEVYAGQPLFGEVDSHLRAAGFEMIDMMNAGYATIRDLPSPLGRSRLLWSEGIYFKTPERLRAMSAEKALKAGLIAHLNYGFYDIAAELLRLVPADGGVLGGAYVDAMCRPGAAAS